MSSRFSKFFILLVVLGIFLAIQVTAYTQKSFTLYLDDYNFSYEENGFNDTNTSLEFDFQNITDDHTYYVRIPKNSTVSNATLTVTGKIASIYEQSISPNALTGLSIGNTSSSQNDIAIGTLGLNGNVSLRSGDDGSSIWKEHVIDNQQVLSTDIDNVTSDAGNEIAAGGGSNVYLLDSGGSEIWNKPIGSDIESVIIDDTNSDGENEIIVGADSVYKLNSSGGTNWSTAVSNIKDLAIGDLSSDTGKEIAVARGNGNLTIINSTGDIINEIIVSSSSLNSVDVKNITTDSRDEILVGTEDGYVFLLDSSGNEIDNYSIGSRINSVKIGDLIAEPGYEGKEIVFSSNDKNIYTLNRSMDLIWSFEARDFVNSVAVGNLTSDPGEEIAAGDSDGYLYTFNFDYFPTNLTLSVDTTKVWDYYEETGNQKIRTSTSVVNHSLVTEINSYLTTCTADSNGNCDVPLVFHSEWKGKLNVSSLNITYVYNASDVFSKEAVNVWSRTCNVRVNESVGNESINISFVRNPANSLQITHIKLNDSSTQCDFNGSTGTVSGGRCDIPDFTLPTSGQLPASALFWEDTMPTDVPVMMNMSFSSESHEFDNFNKIWNVTIWNTSTTTFYNVTANASVTGVHGDEFLNVSWEGSWYDITPSSEASNCNTSSPTYSPFNISGDMFYSCKQDTDGNGTVDFFRWKQPHTSFTDYIVGGSVNILPTLTEENVTPASDMWLENFSFSVNATDYEGDEMNITLWVFKNRTSEWENMESKTGTDSVFWFNVSSDKNWTGQNKYKFEYFDYNGTGAMHSAANTSNISGPTAEKRNVNFTIIEGNDTKVNRTESQKLIVMINDSEIGDGVGAGINCYFWITTNVTDFDSGHYNQTDDSSYCTYTFTPDGNYTVDQQRWMAGVVNDTYYDSNSTNFTIEVHDKINITLTQPSSVLYRNETKRLEAKMIDTYGETVAEQDYNCSFYLNETWLYNTTTNSSGYCYYDWPANCSLGLGNYTINVTLEGNASAFYTILDSDDYVPIKMKDYLNATITNPLQNALYHKTDTIDLNSTVNDTCVICSQSDYTAKWYLNRYKTLRVDLTEASGLSRVDEPYVLEAGDLDSLGIDITQLKVNDTKVTLGGVEVITQARPWTDSSKTALNPGQEYLNNYSDIVFLADVSASGSGTFWITWNETNGQEIISFIKNGGFEAGSLDEWNYTNKTYSVDKKSCSVVNESDGESYSAYMIAYGSDETNYLNQSLYSGSFTRLKIKYKAWGTYDADSYARIYADGSYCDLNLSLAGTSKSQASWTKANCSFSTSTDISITLHTNRSGGYEVEIPHLYVDYICIANATEDCINPQSGAPLERSIIFQDEKGTGDDASWQITAGEEVGKRRFIVNASGEFYDSDIDFVDVSVFGWDYVNESNLTSDYCSVNESYSVCAQSSSVASYCVIMDKNSSEPVSNYTVNFYNDTHLMGYNFTDDNGRAIYYFTTPSVNGLYNITCNITDSPELYYNATEPYEGNYSYYISSDTTNGTLFVVPSSENTTEDITKDYNYSFEINITLNNTGDGHMYSPQLNITRPGGIYVSDLTIPNLAPGEDYNDTVNVNVTNAAPTGVYDLVLNVSWTNGDASMGNATNITTLDIKNNTVLNVVEDEINETVAAGFGKDSPSAAANFTVEAYGNTELSNINFTLVNLTANDATGLITLDPSSIATINQAENQTVLINLSLSELTPSGIYVTNITANSTNSSDWFVLNLNITAPDWVLSTTPDPLNKSIGIGEINGTIGNLQITNYLATNQSFNLSSSGNGTTYIKLSQSSIEVAGQDSDTVKVFHNRTGAQYTNGTYVSNITITNLNGSSPTQMITEVTLEVIELTANILQPNSSSHAGPLNASTNISVRVNVTKPGEILTENVTFEVSIGGTSFETGQNCANTTPLSHSAGTGWNWNCSAPTIPGNVINNTIWVRATSINDDVSTTGDRENAVVYYDITQPKFSAVDADPVKKTDNIAHIPIVVNITDNTAVDDAWVVVTQPNNTNVTLTTYTNFSNTYTFNYSNPNVLGDYFVTVYANDTGGVYGYANNTNSTEGWFDVYEPVNMTGTLKDADGKNIEADFTFYVNNTDYIAHSFSVNSSEPDYDWIVHRRKYDLKVEAFDHEVRFIDIDANESANGSDSVLNPVLLDHLPNYTYPQINIMPSKFQDPILGFVVEANNLSSSSGTNVTANITINYTDALQTALNGGKTINTQNLRVIKCDNWNYSTRSGTLTNDDYINETPSGGLIIFQTTPQTAYIVAEGCYSGANLIDCSGYEETTTTAAGGGGGSSGSKDEEEEVSSFTIDTNLGDLILYQGESKDYWLYITNNLQKQINPKITMTGDLWRFLSFSETDFTVDAGKSKRITASVSIPDSAQEGSYRGGVILEAEGESDLIPVVIKVVSKTKGLFSLEVDIIKRTLQIEEFLKFQVKLKNLGSEKQLKPTLTYLIKDGTNDKVVKELKENVTLEKMLSFTKRIELNDTGLEDGEHVLEVWAEIDGMAVNDMESFDIVKPFLATTLGVTLLYTLLILSIVIATIFIRKYYMSWKTGTEAKKRYLFPVNMNRVPQKTEKAFWIGTLAGSRIKSWLNPDDLMTHVLVAGATGAGKSVGASVIVEEALAQKIPVIVFDPTAQWTGFVRGCRDKNLLKYYPKYGMDLKNIRSYKGMIFEMSDPKQKIDFKEFMNPGEITVFTLNKLKPAEFDEAVRNIINSMFRVNWEESTTLKMIVVFDEVHRLLEKYGGRGGYVVLEKACREFRKWGIGLILCSQVLADFKVAIAGNVLTDIQLNTKSLEDIQKAKDKYGEKYAKRVTRQGLGVGMIHNPKYNDGKPYFIQFRPTYHNPHKITNQELEEYKGFATELKAIKKKIEELKKKGKEIFDLELELRLAEDKLKLGNFRMAKIYITSLKKHLGGA